MALQSTTSRGAGVAWLLALVILCVLAQAISSAKAPTLLDANLEDQNRIESIAQHVCKSKENTSKQISRISTISKLTDFLGSLESSHKLADCAKRHLGCLRALNALLTSENQNVCGPEKISMIENFHLRYISTADEDAQRRLEDSKQGETIELAPVLIRTFFMHYAFEVSGNCKKTLINSLEWDVNGKLVSVDELSVGPVLGAMLKGAGKFFGPVNSVHDFDDVVLVWDLIGGRIPDEQIDPSACEPAKVYAKMHSIGAARQAQDVCRSTYRPIYEKLILPIVELSNLGYSCKSERFERELQELRSSSLVNKWYEIVQICETILPIKLFEDPTLAREALVLIDREEALSLIAKSETSTETDRQTACQRISFEPETHSLIDLDQLPSVEEVEANNLVKRVKTSKTVRQRAMRRALRRLVSSAKEVLYNKTVNLLVSKKADRSASANVNQTAQSDNAQEFRTELVDVQESLTKQLEKLDENELLKMEAALGKSDKGQGGLTRRNKFRRRPGDISVVNKKREEQLAYKHTKSWATIFSEIGDFFSAMLPSRTTLFFASLIVISILTLVFLSSLGVLIIG